MAETELTAFDFFAKGWTAEPASLYDEEGVEGWRWFKPDGDEHSTVIGPWSETPPIPELSDKEIAGIRA